MKWKINMAQTAFVLGLICLLTLAIVYGESTWPSMPTDISVDGNTTNAYPNGTKLNGTRGYIYNMTVTESQPTYKWIGYVGNINGEYALQDAAGNALYDWDILTITGEIYATKEGPTSASNDDDEPYGGGIPDWNNLTCATAAQVDMEARRMNHSPAEEDSMNRTFLTDNFFLGTFYAGDHPVTDDTMFNGSAETCRGIYLNYNNTDGPVTRGNWTEAILTDGTFQWNADSSVGIWDIIYVSLLKNDSYGFNNLTYDFQMILPQNGLAGDQQNVPYYFYTELI